MADNLFRFVQVTLSNGVKACIEVDHLNGGDVYVSYGGVLVINLDTDVDCETHKPIAPMVKYQALTQDAWHSICSMEKKK